MALSGHAGQMVVVVTESAETWVLSIPSSFCIHSAAGRGQLAGGSAQPELCPGHGAAPGPAFHDVPATEPAV